MIIVHVPYYNVSFMRQELLNFLFKTIFILSREVAGTQKGLGKYWMNDSMNGIIGSPQEGQGKLPEEMKSE